MKQNNTHPPRSIGGEPILSKKKHARKRNDLILIGALLAVLLIAGALLLLTREEGTQVRVTVDGEDYGVYPLSKDVEVDIRTGKNSEQLNRLVIKDGKAYVETATCPDGICADHKPISHDGESIICLPHKVVVAAEQN